MILREVVVLLKMLKIRKSPGRHNIVTEMQIIIENTATNMSRAQSNGTESMLLVFYSN